MPKLSSALTALVIGLAAATVQATTIQDFDSLGTAYTLPDGADIYSLGGTHGNVVRLTDSGGGELGQIAFSRADVGAFSKVVANFDFYISHPDNSQADGFGFVLAPTATQGTNGSVTSFSEEANVAGALGIGFDIYNNSDQTFDTNNNHISLHWNGNFLTANTNLGFTLADSQWHHATITADANAKTVSVSVDGSSVFSNYSISGLSGYEYRVAFAGRTGGEVATQYVDNIHVPEPCAFILLGTAAAGFLGFVVRRRMA